jgi:hypothetical protein
MKGYAAETTADGLVVKGVPIFVECTRGEHEFDRDWISKAVEHAKARASEGYFPPLHVRHHREDGDPVVAAGFFRITHAAPIPFQGEERMAIFADLVVTNAMVAQDVAMKRLPWRSVEIYDAKKPSIDTLALLDHEAPYLELPMLFIDSIDGRPSGSTPGASLVTPQEPVAASFERGAGMALLFRFDPDSDSKGEKAEKQGDKDGEAKEEEKMADGAEDESPAKATEENVRAVIAAIEAGTISVQDFELLVSAIRAKAEAGEHAKNEDKSQAPAPGSAKMTKTTTEVAALRGEIDGLRAELAAQKAEAETAKAVDAAMQRLARKPLGAGLKEQLLAFCKAHGLPAFEAYVSGLEKAVGDVPDHIGRTTGTSASQHSAAVLKYQAKGPAALERAVKLARTYKELASFGKARWTEEQFLAINMAAAVSTEEQQEEEN